MESKTIRWPKSILTIFTCLFYRSDIQYSIDDDTESLHKDADPESRTPIIKPSSRQLSNNSDLKGSENSLLNMTDEDLWLRKGMDEDGSFRQVYIKEWKKKKQTKNPEYPKPIFFCFVFLKSCCFFNLKNNFRLWSVYFKNLGFFLSPLPLKKTF